MRDAPQMRDDATPAIKVLTAKKGVSVHKMPHVWHLLYVGVPPSGGDNPHGLKETFVLVQLPASA